ncbi:MAG: glycosyltransferase family 4 protein [Deltaproteobacteria bacterium]|nr:glycosyltransferase family 4 protein [Deltaproteobacteria bacterium]
MLKNAAVRIANSNYTARRVLGAHPDIGPIDVCHLALLPNGAVNWMASAGGPAQGKVDTELLKQVQQHSVLIVGRMEIQERHKGHRQLIEAWPFVKARVPDAQLVIVGRGDDLEGIKARARESGLGSSILITGHVNDATLEAIYQRTALFAMPSRGEGFGLVYLEAMQHGLACIGSIHDAATEVIEPGVTGLLVDQDDLTGLADAISGLLLNPSRREEMGRAGLKRVQKVFSFEQFHDRILSALKPLVKDGSVCAQETNG